MMGKVATKKPSTKGRELTIKQKKFVKAYVKNDGDGTAAAKAAYDIGGKHGITTTSERGADLAAAAIASENLTKPNIREAIDSALEELEITVKAAVQPISDGLQATRFSGIGEDAMEVPDHSIRLTASRMALKLLGAEDNENKGSTVNFNFGQQTFVKNDRG